MKMTIFSLLAVGFLLNVVVVLFVICAVVLILVILVQKGRGGGLGGVFGGGMAGGILGSKTGDFLTWVTVVMTGVFLLLAVVLDKFYRPAPGELGPPETQRSAVPAERPVGEEHPVSSPEAGSTEQPGPAGDAPVPPGGNSDTNRPG
jgi:preprotein translocase subunit SecG